MFVGQRYRGSYRICSVRGRGPGGSGGGYKIWCGPGGCAFNTPPIGGSGDMPLGNV